jgi:hypothetical protein
MIDTEAPEIISVSYDPEGWTAGNVTVTVRVGYSVSGVTALNALSITGGTVNTHYLIGQPALVTGHGLAYAYVYDYTIIVLTERTLTVWATGMNAMVSGEQIVTVDNINTVVPRFDVRTSTASRDGSLWHNGVVEFDFIMLNTVEPGVEFYFARMDIPANPLDIPATILWDGGGAGSVWTRIGAAGADVFLVEDAILNGLY